MTVIRRIHAFSAALAIAVAGALCTQSCTSHGSASAQFSASGLPVYPNATLVGTSTSALAIYRTSDPYRSVADWYGAHMPSGTQTSRNDTMSQATYAVFSPTDMKTAHVEISDGTVRISLTDVKTGPPAATGR